MSEVSISRRHNKRKARLPAAPACCGQPGKRLADTLCMFHPRPPSTLFTTWRNTCGTATMSDAKATTNHGLTDDEASTRWRARIHVVVQNWAQAQKAQGTSVTLPPKHEILEVLHTLVNLEQSVEVPLVVVDRPYHPCHLPPHALRKIPISDLKAEVHHLGSVLIVRRIGIIAQTWARLVAAVEDENGNTCFLTFYHHNRDVPAEEFMPEGAVLAIKQPYLRVDHAHVTEQDPKAYFLCIRVDHPSDLVVLPVSDTSIPSKFASETIFKETFKCLLDSTADWIGLCYDQLNPASSAAELDAFERPGNALIKKVSAMYGKSGFAATLLPRRELAEALMSLVRIDMLHQRSPEVAQRLIRHALQVLAALGFKVKPNGPNDVTFTNVYGIRLNKAEEALKICSVASCLLQNRNLAIKYEALAKDVHQQLNVDATNFQSFYASQTSHTAQCTPM
ncbi:hypothetical protein Q7P37_007775 [Cladosporium fusiforme]